MISSTNLVLIAFHTYLKNSTYTGRVFISFNAPLFGLGLAKTFLVVYVTLRPQNIPTLP